MAPPRVQKDLDIISTDFLDRFSAAFEGASNSDQRSKTIERFQRELSELHGGSIVETAETLLWAVQCLQIEYNFASHALERLRSLVHGMKKAGIGPSLPAAPRNPSTPQRKAVLQKKVVALWGNTVVQDYGWLPHSVKTWQALAKAAAQHPSWRTFVDELNLVIIERHEASATKHTQDYIGSHTRKAEIKNPRSPLRFVDLERLPLKDPLVRQRQRGLIEKWTCQCRCALGNSYTAAGPLELDAHGMLVPSRGVRINCSNCASRKHAIEDADDSRPAQKRARFDEPKLASNLPAPVPPRVASPTRSATIQTADAALSHRGGRLVSRSPDGQRSLHEECFGQAASDRRSSSPQSTSNDSAPESTQHECGRHTISGLRLPPPTNSYGATCSSPTPSEGTSASDREDATSSGNEDTSSTKTPLSDRSSGRHTPPSRSQAAASSNGDEDDEDCGGDNDSNMPNTTPPSSVTHEDVSNGTNHHIAEEQKTHDMIWQQIYCGACMGICQRCLVPEKCDHQAAHDMIQAAHLATTLKLPSKSFLKCIRFAHKYPDLQSAVKNQGACVVHWNEQIREAIQEGGVVLPEIFIIEEDFVDKGRYTPLSLAKKIDSTYGGMTGDAGAKLAPVALRRDNKGPPKLGTISEFTSRLRNSAYPSRNKGRVNALSLPVLMDAVSPDILSCERFCLLKNVIRRKKASMSYTLEKPFSSTPFDVESCEAFSIYGEAGVFSGMHQDFLGGTWLRNLFGRKLWWYVPNMTQADREAFREEGPNWDPGDKARALLIEPDQVLVMPKHIPHAVLTISPCLMEGGMFWDRENIVETLRNLRFTVENGLTTNELLPLQLSSILGGLNDMVNNTEGWTEDKEAVKSEIDKILLLKCDCGECDTTCPCRGRFSRCTQLCDQHPALPYDMACMIEPND